MKNKPTVMSGGDAHAFLKVSRQRFERLVKNYNIPYQQTSAGKIYFKEDLEKFQKERKENMKHARKPNKQKR